MKISNTKMVIHAESLDHDFLYENRSLKELYAPNLKSVGWGFLSYNMSLKEFHAPNLKEVGISFLNWNRNIDKSKYKLVL